MAIDTLFAMKNKPGIMVMGRKNFSAENVFGDISEKLFEFYKGRQGYGDYEYSSLLFVPKLFIEGQEKYYCHVYSGKMPEIKHKHAIIKIERFKEKRNTEYVEEWDFEHAPFISTQQIFGVYFNLVYRDKAKAERDAFLNYFESITSKGIRTGQLF